MSQLASRDEQPTAAAVAGRIDRLPASERATWLLSIRKSLAIDEPRQPVTAQSCPASEETPTLAAVDQTPAAGWGWWGGVANDIRGAAMLKSLLRKPDVGQALKDDEATLACLVCAPNAGGSPIESTCQAVQRQSPTARGSPAQPQRPGCAGYARRQCGKTAKHLAKQSPSRQRGQKPDLLSA